MPTRLHLFPSTILTFAIMLATGPVQAQPEAQQTAPPVSSGTTGTPGATATPPDEAGPTNATPAQAETTPSPASPPARVEAPTLPPGQTATTIPVPKKATKRTKSLRPCSDERPWYCGISEVDRARALELYERGNQLFDDTSFEAAIKKYQTALTHWNHPAIHYNRMLALVVLERPIEAFQASIEALRYGVQALKIEEYRRAVDYQRLLRGQIATLDVTCDEPDAVVSVNGREVLHGPGTMQLLVRPGQYQIVARKDGYLTTQHKIFAVSEKPAKVHMRLLPQSKATIPVRRWPAWQPWAVVGAGVGLGLAGGLLEWQADVNNKIYKTRFETDSKCKDGCFRHEYSSGIELRETRYVWYRRLGHGASVAGGMAVLGGLVFAYLNREQEINNPERRSLVRVSVAPSINHDASGIAVNLTF
jgi:hypothetical protein